MNYQLSLTALWLASALAVLAVATVGRPPSFVSHQFNLASNAEASASCDNGIKGQYSNVHHGWVCSTELKPVPER